ncbi:unnamed protein product [Ceratitis capitata]|uniref:(Mediterranean fruit fly) hypothetical protein n=1 Tax=Ceratitis capitata TaxID=7213 RepID=A0A811V0F0_CERCA|nr:unnamed protein product [Ceratitis capitata]
MRRLILTTLPVLLTLIHTLIAYKSLLLCMPEDMLSSYWQLLSLATSLCIVETLQHHKWLHLMAFLLLSLLLILPSILAPPALPPYVNISVKTFLRLMSMSTQLGNGMPLIHLHGKLTLLGLANKLLKRWTQWLSD